MNKNNLTFFIVELVCGLTCIALGIYYVFCGDAAQIAVFLIVGGVCVITAVRTLFKILKEKKNKPKGNKEEENKKDFT